MNSKADASHPAGPAAAEPAWRPLFAGLFLLAFGTLVFEVALIRVLSYTIWHHFGYVVISTALLGVGAAGSLLAVRPGFGTGALRSTLARGALLSGVSMVGVLGFVSAVPLHPLSLLREPGQAAVLLLYQLAAALPFFLSGLSVSLALREGARRVDRLYAFDLLGAGLGCLAAVALMNALAPPGAVVVAGAALAGSAAILSGRSGERILALAVALACLLGAPLARRLPFTPDHSKEYSLLVELLGAQPLGFEWTALFRTDLLRNGPPPSPPTWGLSRAAPEDLERPGWYLTHDATAGAGIYDLREDAEIDYVPYHIFQLPYLVANPNPRVLVIGVGGGRDVVVARQLGASQVTGVELDPVAVRWLTSDLDAEVGGFFRRPGIRLVAGEGRHFVRASSQQFDVIQLTGVDTLSAVNSGAYVLAENYLYTVEALHDYLDHLTTGGIFSLTTGNLEPWPRYAGRMISVAREALRERGIEHPERHLAVIQSGNLYAEVLVRTTPFEPEQTQALAKAAGRLRMPLLWLPGYPSHPVYAALATTDGAEREILLANHDHRLDATRDDDPFFLSVFRWRGLLEPGRLSPSHASALSQIVLAALLASLTGLGALLILAPLAVFGRRHVSGSLAERLGVLGFFLALGLGFMLFEISLMQRFVLFLGYPTYSLSVTLASLLASLGLGSFLSRRLVGRHRAALALGVVAIAGLALFYARGLPLLQDALLTAPLAARVAVSAALLAPLGLAMGIFLPLGVRVASTLHEDLVPWAWGINGCASVTAGVLAVVLAMSFGFTFVWTLSVAVYAAGTLGLLAATRRLRLG